MASNKQEVVSDGTLTTLLLTLPYYSRSDIHVEFNGEVVDFGTVWNWVGDTEKQIVFVSPVPASTLVAVVRTTSLEVLRHDYVAGAKFTAVSLNESLEQILYVAQEFASSSTITDLRNDLNMHGFKVTNLARATNPGDGVPFSQYNEDLGNVPVAISKANQALLNSLKFDTIDDMRQFIPTAKTYVYASAYSAGFPPGGGGWFKYDPTSGEAHDGIVVFRPLSNPPLGRYIREDYMNLTCKMAGCAWDGSRNDTVRLSVFLNYCAARGIRAILPPGTGRFETVQIRGSMFNFDIEAQGCYLEAMATTPTDALIGFYNCVDVGLIGAWRWNGANKTNYRSMLAFHAIPAEPGAGSQAVTRIRMVGHTFRNCGIGVSVGDFNVDYQCSEISMVNVDWFECPQPIYLGGSNAGFQVFGNVTSEHNAAFPGVVECSVYQEGGFFKVYGSLVTNPTAVAGLVSAPCSSALYGGSLYGTSVVTGAHTEVNSPLMELSNPRGLGNLSSVYAWHMFIGNTGYAGGDVSRDFVYVGEVTYAGVVGVMNCNYYNPAGRTGYNMSSISPLVRFVTDSTSWGPGFSNWISGIGYGRVVHPVIPVLKVTGVNRTFTAGVPDVMKFQFRELDNELLFYAHLYDPATGGFLIPPGGFTHLNIQCSLVANAPGMTGADFWLERSGVVVAYGQWSGGFAHLSAVETNLTNGELLFLVFKPYGANVTISSQKINWLSITGATR